ncbi:SMC domain-containing protein, putative [Bodo saltans]|uniref:SMC domain-containing protein, putative n=1 Tax=Bodo saltans TaxID=75058 RepID=A0A0S4KKB5_BODSA|nr:SMC domain-containing protein, putative [Bodo saltans]|eukprot:CUI14782.1 SMC domain-containing protein, putative [Bodo saltans]
MAFVLLACAEVRGEKLNLELPFEGRPTISDLLEVVERVFRFEASNAIQSSPTSQRDSSEPIFTIAAVQIYADESRHWAELTSPHQLHMYDQLFIVRKYIPLSEGARKEIPRPRTSQYFAGRAASVSMPPPPRVASSSSQPQSARGVPQQQPVAATSGSYSTTPRSGNDSRRGEDLLPARGVSALAAAGNNNNGQTGGVLSATISQALLEGSATPQEVLRVVFEAADKRRHGVITSYDLGSLFRHLAIHIQPEALDEMFTTFAQSGQSRGSQDTVMSLKDFSAWADSYESTLTSMFERIISLEKEHRLGEALRDAATKITDLARQKQELEEAIRRLDQDLHREHDRKHSLDDELDELLRDRQIDASEDQVVIDKEIRVQHHRFLLRQEENDFAQVTSNSKRRSGTVSRSYSTQSMNGQISGTPGRTGSYLGVR